MVDTFQVSDPDYAGVPPVERRASVAETIIRVLKGEEEVERLMSRNTRLPSGRRLPATRQATEVQIDNETCDRSTIIDVFADDTQGLLYAITRSILRSRSVGPCGQDLDLDWTTTSASCAPRWLSVDVFYVTDQHGAKIEDHARLEAIRSTIQKDIDQFIDRQVDGSEGVSTGSRMHNWT